MDETREEPDGPRPGRTVGGAADIPRDLVIVDLEASREYLALPHETHRYRVDQTR
jgi:hypothetical protein